ncbi:MAG: hypothetical protein GY772_08030 [bacterium]|nr:hypothetical protein [bacterium]
MLLHLGSLLPLGLLLLLLLWLLLLPSLLIGVFACQHILPGCCCILR